MPVERIVVTSIGIVSALGIGQAAQIAALKAGNSGLHYPQILQTTHAKEFLIGEVGFSNEDLISRLHLNNSAKGYTRTTLLGMVAMNELLGNADISRLRNKPLAFINASTVGGMSEIENMYMRFISPEDTSNIDHYIDTLDCAESTENIADHFGLKPFMATISTACSSSANAILLGARMLKMGLVDYAICGGADALSRFTLNGFNSLKNVDRQACRPFDDTRFGLNLGEGGAYLLLEREDTALERDAHIQAVLSGYSNNNDAYHPTAPSPDGAGALRTMQNALSNAGLNQEDIGYINAHGTATINNDAAEGKAIEALWNGAPPHFSSTKPFTGHTLAAAGAIEAIFSILAMNEEVLPANLNFTVPMSDVSVTPVPDLTPAPGIRHVLSNSFGFGGNNVTLIFSKA